MSRRHPIIVSRVRAWIYDYPSFEGTYYSSHEIYCLKLKRFEHTERYLTKNNRSIKIIGIDTHHRIWHYSGDAKRLEYFFHHIESYYNNGWCFDDSDSSEESEEKEDYIDTILFCEFEMTKSGKMIKLEFIKSTNLEFRQKFFKGKHKFAVYGLDKNGIVWGYVDDEKVLSTINMSKNYDDLVKNGWSLLNQVFVGVDTSTDEEIHQCLACLDNQRIIAYGCGHVSYCISCHNNIKNKICPLCKTKVTTTLRIFY